MSMPPGQRPLGAPPMWTAPPMAMPKQRPLSVSILAILAIIFGIIGLVAHLVLLGYVAGFAGLLAVLAGLVAVFSIAEIAAGVGLWRLRSWAWWLTIIVGGLDIVVHIGSFVVFPLGGFALGIVLWIIILIYLFVVRQHFGIGAPAQPMMPAPPPM